jgi:hypothetical protein
VADAAMYFLTAYLHNVNTLKQVAIKFIVDNYDLVKATPEMSLIGATHPKALYEILEFAVKR